MTQLRCTLFALLGLTLAACSDDKTIVSVNYSLGAGVAIEDNSDTQVHVLITQGGQKFEATFATPLVAGSKLEELPDGGDGTGMVAIQVPDGAFFQRYELTGFGGGEANLTAELVRGATVLFTSESTFDVRENGAVAAYADFVVEPPPPAETGSSSETAAPSSSAATDAGSSEGATSAPDAASSSAPGTTGDAATTASDSGAVEASSSADAATTGAGSSDASTDGG